VGIPPTNRPYNAGLTAHAENCGDDGGSNPPPAPSWAIAAIESHRRAALELLSEDVAIALGHTDGGELVRKLYGHRDHDRALDRVTAAYDRTASHAQMPLLFGYDHD
jgi:hypothetical protein